MTKNTNASPLQADAREYLTGNDRAEGGRAAMSLHMVPYLATPIVARFHDAKADVDVVDSFTIRDLVMNKPRNVDGSMNVGLQGQRREAAIIDLFGFDKWNIPPRIQTAMDKIVPEAIAVWHYFGRVDGSLSIHMERVLGSVDGTNRRVIGGIAAGDMFELQDKEGQPTNLAKKSMKAMGTVFKAIKRRDAKSDAELLEFMLAYEVCADGKQNSLFGDAKALTSSQFLKALVEKAIADGVLPAPAKRDRPREDKGASFAADAANVLAVLEGVLNTDESPVAFDEKLEGVIEQICLKWAAYKAAFLI